MLKEPSVRHELCTIISATLEIRVPQIFDPFCQGSVGLRQEFKEGDCNLRWHEPVLHPEQSVLAHLCLRGGSFWAQQAHLSDPLKTAGSALASSTCKLSVLS